MENNYEVGYCKPPKNTQFKSGCSGNKKGRPKKNKNDIFDLIELELKGKVPLNDGQMITKEQAMCRQLVNKAASGGKDAMVLVMKTMGKRREKTTKEEFVNRLINERYLNPNDIDRFLSGDKIEIEGKRIPRAIWDFNMNSMYKGGEANSAFCTSLLLADILVYASMCMISQEAIDIAKEEFKFYEGLKAAFDLQNKSEEEKRQAIQMFEEKRGRTRPSKEVYDCACEFEEISFQGLLRKVSMWREGVMHVSEYDKREKNFFDKDNIEERTKKYSEKHSKEEVKALKDMYEEMRNNYEICMQEVFSFKYLDKALKDLEFSLDKFKPCLEWLNENKV